MGAFATAVKTAGEDMAARQAKQDQAFRAKAPLSVDLANQEAGKRLQGHTHMAYMLGKHMRRARPQHKLETELGYSPAEINELEAAPGREIMIPMGKKADDPVPVPRSLGMRMSGFPSPAPAATPTAKPAPAIPAVPAEAPTPFNDVPRPPGLLGTKSGGAIMSPIKHKLQDTLADIMGALQAKKEEATRITEDPATLPTYYPSLALGVPRAFQQGFSDEHKHLTGHVKNRLNSDLASAKAEFEAAMGGEAQEPALAKTAAVFDALADTCLGIQDYCMSKEAAGELNKLLNTYFGLATLLGSGTFEMGHSWAKKNDKNVQQLKAVKELMRQRAYMQPPTILTEMGDSNDDSPAVDRKALDVQYEPPKPESSDLVNAN